MLSPSGQVVHHHIIAPNLHSDYKENRKANESKGEREATQMLSMLASQRTKDSKLTVRVSPPLERSGRELDACAG